MKQVLVEQLRPGDHIQTLGEVARVVDVPAKCYAGDRIYVLVPIQGGRSEVVEWRYAPGDFVSLADQVTAALARSSLVITLITAVALVTYIAFALVTLPGF
ncbi:MAG TPA: hypothetical protein VNS55_12040 [Nocardioides sp.]|nr:hypothetical protein [Nocardioides sp.]